MKTIDHPVNNSDFPFIRLSDIQKDTILKASYYEGVVIDSPIETQNGEDSMFQALFRKNNKIICETFMGSSDKKEDVWVYSSGILDEIKPSDKIYDKCREILLK